MATRIRIKTTEDDHVHFDLLSNDYTLCGMETKGDEMCGFQEGVITTRRVNCPECIRIVEFCHQIKKSEFKTNPR